MNIFEGCMAATITFAVGIVAAFALAGVSLPV